jgi:Nucleoside diphosphate kinase
MTTEKTFSIIKPDAVERNKIGEITAMLESAGLRIVASKRIKLDQEKAAAFYSVHADKPFFQSLCDFMCSGPIVVQVLEGENAIQKNREVMGATNPDEAAQGTIRKKFALSLEKNSVHGSDSPENAVIEINHFFSDEDIIS